MKPHVKAASRAAAWALALCGAFILVPLIIGLVGGVGVSGKVFAEKLIVGVALFPMLFLIFWVWGLISKKDPITGAELQQTEPELESAQRSSDGEISSYTEIQVTKSEQLNKDELGAVGCFAKGQSFFKSGKYQQAIDSFDNTVTIAPKYALAYYLRGLAQYKVGNRKQALYDLQTAAKLGHKKSQEFLEKGDV